MARDTAPLTSHAPLPRIDVARHAAHQKNSRSGLAAIKRWIATAAIMVNHVQTVSILGNLRLEFPPAVEVITSGAGLDILEMIGSVRPECLLVDTGSAASASRRKSSRGS